jgi:fermentation-respiration switch protein FrsA (DUF1100 family)
MTSAPKPVNTIRIRPTMAAAVEPVDDNHYLPSDPALQLWADPKRRSPVRFKSNGVPLAGHLYRPPGFAQDRRTPAIVMCGPFSSVKEQTLPHYAERFADAGYTVLTFDPRTYGESEGEPRAFHDPTRITEDYVNATRYMMTREDVDPDNVAAVGVCIGGGYAVSAAARERKIKAVVSIAGGFNVGGTFQQFMGIEGFAAYSAKINAVMREQYRTGKVQYVPTIAQGFSEVTPVAAMPNPEAYSYYSRTYKSDAPTWSEKMAVASLEAFYSYNALVHVPLIAPAPFQIIHGTKDLFLLPEYARQAYDAALGPKELIWIETHNHIELYDQDPYVSIAVANAIRWLDSYLK